MNYTDTDTFDSRVLCLSITSLRLTSRLVLRLTGVVAGVAASGAFTEHNPLRRTQSMTILVLEHTSVFVLGLEV